MDFPPIDLGERPSKRRRTKTDTVPEDTSDVGETNEIEMAGEETSTPVLQQKNKGKEKKNKGRRDRRATSYHKAEGEGSLERRAGPKALRLPKRQCALLLGFCGSGYSGMQMYVPDVVFAFYTNVNRRML